MKKVLKIIGVIVGIIILISLFSSKDNSEVKDSFNKGMKDAQEKLLTPAPRDKDQSFTENDAISKAKLYDLKENLNSIDEPTKGMALSLYLEKLVLKDMKVDPNTTTGSWLANAKNDNTFTVSYKFRTLGLDQVFTWEVNQDSIIAINGKAISTTPELGPKEKEVSGTDREKEIYNYSMGLYKNYENTLGSYEAETRATKETAAKFKITEKEVKDIVGRLINSKL